MRPLKYKILSHTADLRLEVFGKTLEELFENAAEALASILAKSEKRQATSKLREKIKIESVNLNALLVDFLNEILSRSHINKAIYKVSNVKCQMSDVGASVEAELVGRLVREFDEDIKAVTHHGVDIRESGKGKAKSEKIWHAKLVLDI